jgi:predicted acetyltransferase
VPQLIEPDSRVASSFRAAMADFVAEGRAAPGDDSSMASDIRQFGDSWHTDQGFADFAAELRGRADERRPRPAGWTHVTTFWWVAGAEFLGSLRIRHELIEPVLAGAGLIGYDVAPRARRQGHGTAMLRAALPFVRELGFPSALITCDPGNVGSRRVIEKNGGVFEAEANGKLRYWVPTGGPAAPAPPA